jgi:hypothetical protein
MDSVRGREDNSLDSWQWLGLDLNYLLVENTWSDATTFQPMRILAV